MLSIQKQLINYNFSKRNGGIKYIVVHDVGAVSSAQNNRDYFAGGNRNASADFFVDSNNIIQIIDYHNNYSWAVGDGRGRNGITNGNSVSIEMCLESNMQPSQKTIQNTLDLVKYLMNELNVPIDRVVTHNMASGKNCPQSFSANNWAKWHEFKAGLAGIGYSQPQQQSKPTQSTTIDSSVRDKVGYITGNGVNVRLDGNMNAKILGSVNKGDKVTLWSLEGEWYHCYSLYKGYNRCYIHKDYIQIGSNPVSNSNNTGGGDWITRLQAECNKQGFSNQKVDGIPGRNTLTGCPTLRQGARGNITKLLQERLNALGYGTNGIDGIFGGGTYNAVAAFQRKHGLSADGIVGQNTWRKLLGL